MRTEWHCMHSTGLHVPLAAAFGMDADAFMSNNHDEYNATINFSSGTPRSLDKLMKKTGYILRVPNTDKLIEEGWAHAVKEGAVHEEEYVDDTKSVVSCSTLDSQASTMPLPSPPPNKRGLEREEDGPGAHSSHRTGEQAPEQEQEEKEEQDEAPAPAVHTPQKKLKPGELAACCGLEHQVAVSVVDVGSSDGPGVQAYTKCNTSVAVEGRCVRGHVQAPCFEARGENWRGPAREAGMGLADSMTVFL